LNAEPGADAARPGVVGVTSHDWFGWPVTCAGLSVVGGVWVGAVAGALVVTGACARPAAIASPLAETRSIAPTPSEMAIFFMVVTSRVCLLAMMRPNKVGNRYDFASHQMGTSLVARLRSIGADTRSHNDSADAWFP
jgi:hypothetical protein